MSWWVAAAVGFVLAFVGGITLFNYLAIKMCDALRDDWWR